MYSEVQGAIRKRCRELKKKGYTVKEIVKITHFPRSTIGRYVKGIRDQREIWEIPTETASPTNPTKSVGNMGNTDQDAISHKSQGKGKVKGRVKVGGITLLVGIVILILVILLIWYLQKKGYFGDLGPPEETSQGEQGFEGQDLSGLE